MANQGARHAGTAMALLALLSGCGLPANVVVLEPDEGGTTGRVVVSANGAGVELSRPLAALDTRPGRPLGKPFVADRNDVDRAFAQTIAARPRAPRVFELYFYTDVAIMDPISGGDLAAAIAAARATPNADISVVGNSDDTGTNDFNQPLSRRRAEVIRDALVAGGVSPDVLSVEYHGASNPVVPSPRGVPEARNRRVEITIR